MSKESTIIYITIIFLYFLIYGIKTKKIKTASLFFIITFLITPLKIPILTSIPIIITVIDFLIIEIKKKKKEGHPDYKSK